MCGATEKSVDGDLAFEPGEQGAETVMAPQPERQVPVRLARDVQLLRVGEMALVVVGRADGREDEFPAGAVLSTGTSLVPDLPFTLEAGDEVRIRISGIGELVNPVVRGKAARFARLTEGLVELPKQPKSASFFTVLGQESKQAAE